MLGFCIEASHERGLGHLYRTLNFINYLNELNEPYLVMINDDLTAINILKQHAVNYVTVSSNDLISNWETSLIKKNGINVWINDRLATDIIHAGNVKKNGIGLVTFDDRGTGAALADLHFAPLVFSNQESLLGKRVFSGIRYLILNREINEFRRVRTQIHSVLVTLGGSDTFGVTLQVVILLKKLDQGATIIIGPSFGHQAELKKLMDERFTLRQGVTSLIKEFASYDLAITGGGITPFEANATGLPSIIVANEQHEVEIGQHLERLGSSVFAGHHEKIDEKVFKMDLDIEKMSKAGMQTIGTDGAANVYREISAL